ncbi:Erm Leader peptide [Staphylococcus aureus]|uniref:Erm Leader peptide n=1 Tax=Staphylococcus aureus TaxID=1280 RepID=A0AAU9H3B8_STAAU|nr:erythromycin resistance leader peptide [Staphylococcus aureus]CAA4168007.1 Erm Leader peptide [Staphylococcus aureus]CAA4169558.1 Erm Leader peptide [Staphylococcus aureus]CAA4622072.1 Erm Leader peptide [Staphylococcus aureus]CAA4652136.1 Erm Leader peptide [Staphylococcus aureus]CAA4658194.1 Erm Leader peptide [Staphylococcus aureus]
MGTFSIFVINKVPTKSKLIGYNERLMSVHYNQ